MTTYYKVLVDGASCNGGSLRWSLPHDGVPGEWHKVEGELFLCRHGIHITDEPALWWKPGCAVYVVEAEGVVGSCDDDRDRKVVCRRARLVREVTADELDALRIWSSGAHRIDKLPCVVSDSASVRASGSASVEAWDSASVEAWDSASVRASDSASVRAWGSASVRAWGSASVRAWGSASVRAWDSANVKAYGSASVRAWDSANVKAYGSASVRARGDVTVITWSGCKTVVLAERAVWVDRTGDEPRVEVAAKEAEVGE